MNLDQYVESNVRAIQRINRDSVKLFLETLTDCYIRGGTVFLVGNGGSGSNASHGMCDFSKGVSQNSDLKLKSYSLNDQIAAFSAWINDSDPLDVYVNMAKSLIISNDLVILISGSGNSENLIRLNRWCTANQVQCLALLGSGGGRLIELCPKYILVDSNDMQIIENCHLLLLHWFYKSLSEISPNAKHPVFF